MIVVITLSPRDYDAVLFDLDGVLTKTASVHAAAWKKLFDSFLEQRATQAGEPFVPFDIDTDYPRYVDGKPRYDGVAACLESRGIELPLGAPEDGPDAQSVHALGNLKDRYFLKHLEQHGVEPYDAAIMLVRTLRAQQIKTAVVFSSNNCVAVPETARSLRMYRYRRLGEARASAAAAGYKGAMFPWQSGSDGQEETQALNLNPRSQRWVPDNSYLQRHVGSAIAFNVWQYFQVTRDVEFLHSYGAAAPISLCVDGKVCEFVSSTSRVFRLNEDAADGENALG